MPSFQRSRKREKEKKKEILYIAYLKIIAHTHDRLQHKKRKKSANNVLFFNFTCFPINVNTILGFERERERVKNEKMSVSNSIAAASYMFTVHCIFTMWLYPWMRFLPFFSFIHSFHVCIRNPFIQRFCVIHIWSRNTHPVSSWYAFGEKKKKSTKETHDPLTHTHIHTQRERNRKKI